MMKYYDENHSKFDNAVCRVLDWRDYENIILLLGFFSDYMKLHIKAYCLLIDD